MEVEWFDKQIGEAIQILEQKGELENTVIIITSDHGMSFFELAFSFRAQEEFFDLKEDPDCIQNLAFSQEYRSFKDDLSKKMIDELKNHKDPRIMGDGGVFDTYYYMGFEAMKKMYGDRFTIPENLKEYEYVSNGKVE